MGRGLSRQLRGWFVGSIAAPLVLVAIVASLAFTSRLEHSRVVDITNALTLTAEQIENSLGELDRIAFSPYLYNDLFTMLVYADRGYLGAPPAGQAATVTRVERTYVNTLVKMMYTAGQTIRSIIFYPAGGDGHTAYALTRTKAGLQAMNVPSYRDTAWFGTSASQGRAVTIDEHPEPVLSLSTMIRDQDRHRDLGVLQINVVADETLASLSAMSLPAGDRLLLIDESGAVLRGEAIDWQQNNSGYTTVEAPIPSVGWRLVYLANQVDALRSTVLMVSLAVVAALMILALSYAIYRRESRSVVAGTNEIVSTLQRMRSGDLNTTSGVHRDDWLGTIAESVNHLGSELSSHIDREYRAVIDRQHAEYRALQAQISPHFLYNVFNDFMAMNRLGQRERLNDSILQMTRLLRYSCATGDFATVRQEVDFAQQYLFLRQMELDDRMSYEILLAEECADVPMPRLIVQPLVENAIKHGIPDDRPLHIRIRAELSVHEPPRTRITVTDDGIGFNPDGITETSGFATMSIRERLRILSPDSTLQISSRPGEGTCSVLEVGAIQG